MQPQNGFILINEAIHHASASLAKNAVAFLGKGSPFPVLRFFSEEPGFLLEKRQENWQYMVLRSGILRYIFLPIQKGLTWQSHALFQE